MIFFYFSRTWFHFGVSGGPPGAFIKINVMNLNRQGKLYFHGMKPVFKVVPSKDNWKRIPGKVDFRVSFSLWLHSIIFPFQVKCQGKGLDG